MTESEACVLQARARTLSLVELTSQARKQGLVRKSGLAGRLEAGSYAIHRQPERRAGESLRGKKTREEAEDTLERDSHQGSISYEPAGYHAMLCQSPSFT